MNGAKGIALKNIVQRKAAGPIHASLPLSTGIAQAGVDECLKNNRRMVISASDPGPLPVKVLSITPGD